MKTYIKLTFKQESKSYQNKRIEISARVKNESCNKNIIHKICDKNFNCDNREK